RRGARPARRRGGAALAGWVGCVDVVLPAEARMAKARTTAIVVFAVTVAARDPQRLRIRIRHDDRMAAIRLAGSAVVLDLLAGTVTAGGRRHPEGTILTLSLLLDLRPPVEAPFDLLLEPALGRIVVLASLEGRWQARHVGDGVRLVVRVLVALAVLQVLH